MELPRIDEALLAKWNRIREIREPIVTVHLYMPQDYVGVVMTLANQKRGVQLNMAYHGKQVMLTYELPLGEIVLDDAPLDAQTAAQNPGWK